GGRRPHLRGGVRPDAVPDRPLHVPRLPPATGRFAEDALGLPVASVVALSGPRCEHEQDACSVPCGDRATLVRVEREEAARVALDGLAAALDTDRTVHDGDEGPFLHLVVAELLTGIERDQDRTRCRVGPQDDGRATAARRVDLAQVPALHRRDPKRAGRSRLTTL